MTLSVTLPSDLENRLDEVAARHGVSPEEFVRRLLENQLRTSGNWQPALALIQSWIDVEDTTEQQATGDYLIQALDIDRPSNRKLFPSELEGNTW